MSEAPVALRPLAEKFEEFARKSIPPEASATMRDLVRLCFYTGALALNASINEAANIGLEQMVVIHQELKEFRESCIDPFRNGGQS